LTNKKKRHTDYADCTDASRTEKSLKKSVFIFLIREIRVQKNSKAKQ